MIERFPDLHQHGFRRISAGRLGWLILSLSLLSCTISPEAKEAQYLTKGKSLLAKKDYGRALIEFKNANKIKPKDAEPPYQAGLAYLASGRPANAIAAFRQAVALNPNHAGAQLKLAEMLTASRNKEVIEQARTRLEKIVADSPDNPEANEVLALAALRLGQTDDATRRLEETLARFPTHLSSSVTLTRLKLSQNDTAGAEEILEKAVASAPQSAEAALALGEFYLVLKNDGKAEVEFLKAVQLDPRNGPALVALGRLQTRAKRFAEADQTYQRIAQLPDSEYKPSHAIYLYSIGQRERALPEFEHLAKNDPNDRQARTRLLALNIEMGKITQARNILDAALKKNNKDTDALLQRSALYSRAGKTSDAERDLKQVLHYQPNSAQAHYALADVYRAQGLHRNQRQELNEVLRLQPEMVAARLTLAREFLKSKEATSALNLLNQTPQSQKNLAGVVEQRNWALLATNATKEVDAELKRDLQAGRAPAFVLQEAVLKLTQGDFETARSAAEEVLKSRPADVRAVRVILDSYSVQKQPVKATARLRQIAEAQPKSAPLQYLAANWFQRNGRSGEARKALELAKAADPKFVDADIALAELDRGEKHSEAARQRIGAVLTANPANVQARLMMAVLNEGSGDRQDAIDNYRAVLQADSSNLFALNNLAYKLASERPDEALKMAQQAAEIAPDNPTVQDTLGWVYFHKGLYDSALGYLKAAYTKQPTPKRQYHLAMCYLKSGDQDQGITNLRAALRKDPSLGKEQER